MNSNGMYVQIAILVFWYIPSMILMLDGKLRNRYPSFFLISAMWFGLPAISMLSYVRPHQSFSTIIWDGSISVGFLLIASWVGLYKAGAKRK
jgi:hypothetical protein